MLKDTLKCCVYFMTEGILLLITDFKYKPKTILIKNFKNHKLIITIVVNEKRYNFIK